jgi:hypothetical protein
MVITVVSNAWLLCVITVSWANCLRLAIFQNV